jgi:hypothetical protein
MKIWLQRISSTFLDSQDGALAVALFTIAAAQNLKSLRKYGGIVKEGAPARRKSPAAFRAGF